jgi:micrococcal nuclease
MEIVKVSDGDTFKVRRVPSLEGSSSESASSESASSNTPVYTLRLIGIDTPEKYMSSKLRRDAERSGRDVETIQALGRAATDYAKQLLTGPDGNYQRVTLSYDKANAAKGHRGRYGRVIAYVWILNRQGERGFMVNRRLVADGYAYAYTSFPFTHADEFVALQRQAIEAGRGLWGDSAASTGPTGQKAAGQKAAGQKAAGQKAAGQKAAGQKAAGQNTSQKTTNQAPRRTQEAPTSPPPLRYDPSGPDRDCSDFATEAEAQRFFEAAAPGDPHRLDRDGNGRACESLEL